MGQDPLLADVLKRIFRGSISEIATASPPSPKIEMSLVHEMNFCRFVRSEY